MVLVNNIIKVMLLLACAFPIRIIKSALQLSTFSHFITMNKTSKFLVLLKPSLRSCLPYVLNARNDILKEDKII